MIDAVTVEAFGRDLVEWAARANGWGLAAFVGVLAIDRLLARHVAPGWRMTLYILVFARVLMPQGWSSPWGVFPADGASVDVTTAVVSRTLATSSPDAVIASELSRLGWGTGAVFIHLLGSLFLVARIAAGRRRLQRIRAVAVPSDLAYELGCNVVEHPSDGPLAMGVRDPMIVLPSAALDLPRRELFAILRHERAHLRHRDPTVQSVLALGCALAWPVLAVWLAAARIRLLMEVRADAEATRPLDAAGRRRYGKMLLRLASTGELVPAAMGLGWTHLRTRLRALRRRRTTSVSTQVFIVGVAATTLITLLAKRAEREPAEMTTPDQGPALKPEAGKASTTPTSDPKARAQDLDAWGGGDANALRATVKHRTHGLTRCYDDALQAQPDLAGTMTFTILVDMAGTVSKVVVDEDTLRSSQVAACAKTKIQRWRFPMRGEDEGAEVTFTVAFTGPP